MSYVLRVLLPDRPGSLGAVATALGQAGADILAMDIVERRQGQAVDDLVVDVPAGRQPDTLITAAEAVPGVRVESVRPDPGVADRHREWQLVEAIAEAPEDAYRTLARFLPHVLSAGWALVVRTGPAGRPEVLAAGGGAPELDGIRAGWGTVTRATTLDAEADWVPESWRQVSTHLAVAPIGNTDVVILLGRPGGPALRDSEVARLGHLAGLVAAVQAHAGEHSPR